MRAFPRRIALPFFAGMGTLSFTVSILGQEGLGHSALLAGAVLVPFALGDCVAALASAHLVGRRGRAVGCLLLFAGLGLAVVVLWASSPAPDGWWLVPPLFVGGSGTGVTIAPNQDSTIGRVQPTGAGAASALLGASQRVGNALGIWHGAALPATEEAGTQIVRKVSATQSSVAAMS